MKYIVRANSYNYNDENFFIESAGSIAGVFDSRQEAIAERNARNIDEIDDYDRLNDFLFNSENEDEKADWLIKYYHDNFRITLEKDDYYIEDDITIPNTATDEQIVTILGKLGISFYEVYEHDTAIPMIELQPNPQFWGNDGNQLIGEFGRSFYFSENEATTYLKENLSYAFYEDDAALKGSFEQLSDTPDILESFINSSQSLTYDTATATIKRKDGHWDVELNELRGLFNLLKIKPYTVVPFSVEEAQKLAGTQPAEQPKPAKDHDQPGSAGKKWWQFWK